MLNTVYSEVLRAL